MASAWETALGQHPAYRPTRTFNLHMSAPPYNPRDPLHGITLENMLNQIVERHGWREMGRRIPIRCFMFDPTITSSLKFLRRTPWARLKVEMWFREEFTER